MKYIIETEDQDEFRLNFNGPELYSAVWDFQQFLRNKWMMPLTSSWKYNDTTNEAWFKASQALSEILLDHGINMEEDYC